MTGQKDHSMTQTELHLFDVELHLDNCLTKVSLDSRDFLLNSQLIACHRNTVPNLGNSEVISIPAI